MLAEEPIQRLGGDVLGEESVALRLPELVKSEAGASWILSLSSWRSESSTLDSSLWKRLAALIEAPGFRSRARRSLRPLCVALFVDDHLERRRDDCP